MTLQRNPLFALALVLGLALQCLVAATHAQADHAVPEAATPEAAPADSSGASGHAAPGDAAPADAAPGDAAHGHGDHGGHGADSGQPPDFEPIHSRWYEDPWALANDPVYEINRPGRPFDPYRQSKWKGDFPMFSHDIFLSLTVAERLDIEGRKLPTGTGITGPRARNEDFFGRGGQFQVTSYTTLTADLFRGHQAFMPVEWRLRGTGVFNATHVKLNEVGGVNPDVSRGEERDTNFVALQEMVGELHLANLSDRFDFLAVEAGILPFRSDFRGFIFDDVNLGARLFGNYDNNRLQYNLAVFNQLEKDTNSELNTFETRDQFVLIANLIRQDFIVPGYNLLGSFHYNRDHGKSHFDENDFLVRPAPVGLARENEIDAYYLGIAGEGHIGRLNISHAFYQVLGQESANAFAARDVDINAQFAAMELSYDVDWMRVRGFGQYASGDDDTRDDNAEGFDSIIDAPVFGGSEFSFWNRQGVRLLGVGLTQRLSPLTSLRTSKAEGQSNFVNPGFYQIGGALDFEITPRTRMTTGASYYWFAETDPLQTYLELESIEQEIGGEWFIGGQYRPLLTNNIIFNAGFSVFEPGAGFEKIYQSDDTLYSLFSDMIFSW